MQVESRAAILWDNGTVGTTDWLPDDGSQKIVDQMIQALVSLLNRNARHTCAIKWERRVRPLNPMGRPSTGR